MWCVARAFMRNSIPVNERTTYLTRWDRSCWSRIISSDYRHIHQELRFTLTLYFDRYQISERLTLIWNLLGSGGFGPNRIFFKGIYMCNRKKWFYPAHFSAQACIAHVTWTKHCAYSLFDTCCTVLLMHSEVVPVFHERTNMSLDILSYLVMITV